MRATALPPLLVLALAGVCPAADVAPAPRPVAAPTRVTGPLDKMGRVDYEAALNEWLSKGVTPDTNANVLLVRALGPTPDGRDGLLDEYFRRLGVPRPPKDGDYFVGMFAYGWERLGLRGAELEALYDQEWRAARRPWKVEDFPSVAAWLKLNEKPLGLVVEATKRPEYYNPLVTRPGKNGEPGWLIGALMPTVAKCRDVAGALAARAMLRVGEGKFDEAWADLLACHRLGRLVSRGGTLIEWLTGVALQEIAAAADLAYLDAAKLTAEQARARLNDIQGLPPFRPVADIVDHGERCVGLNTLQMIRRSGRADLLGGAEEASPEDVKALESLDWAEMDRVFDGWYDREVRVMRVPDRAAREAGFDRLDQDRKAAVKASQQPLKPGPLAKLLGAPGVNAKTVSRAVGEALFGTLSPAVRRVGGSSDRAEQAGQNLRVAFALAAYLADEGRYPAKLADLAPKHLPEVPDDLFAGKPLVYRPGEKGYLLYSVGPNGKDDGGRVAGDDPPGDDVRVRMPPPPPKEN
jgi:hypothetical protein